MVHFRADASDALHGMNWFWVLIAPQCHKLKIVEQYSHMFHLCPMFVFNMIQVFHFIIMFHMLQSYSVFVEHLLLDRFSKACGGALSGTLAMEHFVEHAMEQDVEQSVA